MFGLGCKAGGKITDKGIVGESSEGGHKQGHANVGMTVFGQAGFALTRGAGTTFRRVEAGHGDSGIGVLKAQQVKGNQTHGGEGTNTGDGEQKSELSFKGGNGLSESLGVGLEGFDLKIEEVDMALHHGHRPRTRDDGLQAIGFLLTHGLEIGQTLEQGL